VCFNEEIKLAGSIDMVFQDKYTKEFHIYDWKRVRRFLTTARSTSSLKQSVYRTCQNFGNIAQLNTYKAIGGEVWMKIVDLYLIACHPDNPSKTYEKIECMDLTKEVGICLRSDV
jgi:hypothetical protein